jgi:3-oxoacyl-[acyl-carrier-protein] synthase-3
MIHGVRITGVGAEIPTESVRIADVQARAGFGERFGVDPGWLERVTGVRERRAAAPHVPQSLLAARAGRKALEDARLDALWIDALIFAGVTSDGRERATANRVADAIGAHNARTFDLLNACNGFIDAVDLADALVRSGKARRVLVTTAERSFAADGQVRTFEEMVDAAARLVVSDGGGAVVIEESEDRQRGLREREFRSRRMRPRDPIEDAVSLLLPTIEEAMKRTGWEYDEVDVVFCQSPTGRLVEDVVASFGAATALVDRLWTTTAHFGNTRNASLPLAMVEAQAAGLLRRGVKVLVLAHTPGVSAAAATIVW